MTRMGRIRTKRGALNWARAIGAGLVLAGYLGAGLPAGRKALAAAGPEAGAEPAVELSESQLKAIRTEAAGFKVFPQEQSAVGTIDFNQELLTQVFTPYQGRILKAYP